ncbi:serine/threonine-protein phosphatase 4 regulatory subunit 1-like isoform X2 [Adelges cooleyi]|uniref:serine/threonine-protein phosphatase 4 regulatory subunit 1-like isoform X2 n=1 Tax=Adelges cooleyi TaxID=133065 RepID=UPI0021804671|nr:serine/threonine-protein phosphatase 4 regulatory subunit 1-like isoform X2 [Adelges cooleyi]
MKRRRYPPRNTTPKYISCCMKSVIKDHLEMIPDILSVIKKMTKDEDKLMRFDTISTVGYLCTIFHQHNNLKSYIHSSLLPEIIGSLSDPAEQVIMRAQMVLTYIISKGVIDNKTVQETVCPALILAANATDDLHVQNNIVTLVGKLVLKVDDNFVCKTVLPFLINKSQSDCIYVRLAALLSFPELGHVLDIEQKTKVLLPRYVEMCNDRVSTIRKTCADIITPLSACCDDSLRRGPVTDAASRLLSDSCKFVRLTALENLGPLITTYANPAVTSLVTTRTYILMMVSNFTDDLHYMTMKCQTSQEYFKATELLMDREKPWSNETSMKNDNKFWVADYNVKTESEELYSTFAYWREPICDTKSSFNFESDYDERENDGDRQLTMLPNKLWYVPMNNNSTNLNCTEMKKSEFEVKPVKEVEDDGENKSSADLIVPSVLLDHYADMAGAFDDSDLASQCACMLPAVLVTIGPSHWPLLRHTYYVLASHRSWKVRRKAASYIHKLAIFIGEEATSRDLLPIFESLVLDLDEVRSGAIDHFSAFLRMLSVSVRSDLAPMMCRFLKTDYEWNWRFRQNFCEQLAESLHLFTPLDMYHHIHEVCLSLLMDRISSVRQSALSLVPELLVVLNKNLSLKRLMLNELVTRFGRADLWSRRQMFAQICSYILSCGERCLSAGDFCNELLPSLLNLASDRVPNVRLMVAKTLYSHVANNPIFMDLQNPQHDILSETLIRLRRDEDRDVRYFADSSRTLGISAS